MRLWAAIACWLLLGLAAFADTRVALVIGNGTYANANVLANPVNDATDLTAALERIGFVVTRATNLDANAMRAALKAFRGAADGSDIALIFYAGHGLEVDHQNYLVPVDATLERASDVLYDAIPLDLLTEAVSGAKTLSLVLLDACRNNPFAQKLAGSTRSIGRGLSPIEPQGGTLVAFSAKGGTVAHDGTGRNSPFTKALLQHIAEPGMDVSLLFRKVRDDVLADTANQQEPYVYGSLPGREIYLVPPAEVAAVAPQPVAAEPEVTSEAEEFAWGLVRDTADVAKLADFIALYPRGSHIEEAIARMTTLSAPVAGGVAIEGEQQTASLAVTVPTDQPAGTEVNRTVTVAPTAVEPRTATEIVASIQQILAGAGCEPGPVDGHWGGKSSRALEAYAKAGGLIIGDPSPGQPLLDALGGKTGVKCVPPAATTATTEAPKATPKKASVSNLKGSCLKQYQAWQTRAKHKAFAMTPGGACGYAYMYFDEAGARKRALAECGKHGDDCVVVGSD